jgi:hypothetical protein
VAHVYIDNSKIREVTAFLAGLETRLTDLSVPIMPGAVRARNDTLQDFNTGGATSGDPWSDLAASTRKRDKYKDRAGKGRPIGAAHRPLILSRRFYDSVRWFVEKFAGGVSLGPAHWLNTHGTTNPKTGEPKNPGRDAGYISDETVTWTAENILAYAVRNAQK